MIIMTHYYSEEQEMPIEVKEVKVDLFGTEFIFKTANEVFSKGRIDSGSYVFLKGLDVKDKMRVLDLGCGYGTIGIYLAKNYDLDVVMTDINKRAVSLAKENAKLNNVKG